MSPSRKRRTAAAAVGHHGADVSGCPLVPVSSVPISTRSTVVMNPTTLGAHHNTAAPTMVSTAVPCSATR